QRGVGINDGDGDAEQRRAVMTAMRGGGQRVGSGAPLDDQIRTLLVQAALVDRRAEGWGTSSQPVHGRGTAAFGGGRVENLSHIRAETLENRRFIAEQRRVEVDFVAGDLERGIAIAGADPIDLAVLDQADAVQHFPLADSRAVGDGLIEFALILRAAWTETALV